jgi:hypothetical protein
MYGRGKIDPLQARLICQLTRTDRQRECV